VKVFNFECLNVIYLRNIYYTETTIATNQGRTNTSASTRSGVVAIVALQEGKTTYRAARFSALEQKAKLLHQGSVVIAGNNSLSLTCSVSEHIKYRPLNGSREFKTIYNGKKVTEKVNYSF